MKIKVCGMTDLVQVQALDVLGVDMAGFIFYPGSTRFVEKHGLDAKALKALNLKLKKVGVFVNAAKTEILAAVEAYGLDMLQLHGDESPELCAELSAELPVIKAVQVAEGSSLSLDIYQEVSDYFLLDSGQSSSGQYGGTGRHFDWSVLEALTVHKPWFLSGGIAPGDGLAIRELAASQSLLTALDLNSRFETAPGIKDLQQIEQFINDIRR